MWLINWCSLKAKWLIEILYLCCVYLACYFLVHVLLFFLWYEIKKLSILAVGCHGTALFIDYWLLVEWFFIILPATRFRWVKTRIRHSLLIHSLSLAKKTLNLIIFWSTNAIACWRGHIKRAISDNLFLSTYVLKLMPQ